MSDWSKLRIFFPGPTWVAPEVRAAMSAQVLHHRTGAFRDLHARVVARLRRTVLAAGPGPGAELPESYTVALVTASGTGLMEGAVRNLVRERCLCLASGAFGERLHQIALANGKAADLLAVEWGRAVRPAAVREALASGRYDTVTLIHNETSTGVMNPLAEVAAVVREFPGVVLAVDAVSSLGGVPIAIEPLGLDFVFAGVQKCLALPPGLSIVAASPKALERARSVPARGTYFDLVEMHKTALAQETPFTPSVPHIAALDVQLERVEKEGIEARHARHAAMADRVRAWARQRFALFAEPGFESQTVTAIDTAPAAAGGSAVSTPAFDTARFLKGLEARGFVCASGYGKLKGRTFRIGHMGDLGVGDVEELLGVADQVLDEMRGGA